MQLTQEHKVFIVQHLACYFTPTEVMGLVRDRWDIEVPKSTNVRAKEVGNMFTNRRESDRPGTAAADGPGG